MTSVGEIMSPVRNAFHRTDPLSAAIEAMSKNRQSCALVCDNSVPVGIITERDIVRVFANSLHCERFPRMALEEVMSREPICIQQHKPLAEALVLARSRGVRHLPVVGENDELVGILTQNDAISAYLTALDKNSQLREAYEALKLLSLEDPLLGIGNRRAMDADLQHSEAAAKRYCKPYAVAMFDVDYFKAYNDRYGHQKGDQALLRIVALIQNSKREIDRLYRYGGEEFLLLMPTTGSEDAVQVAQRIRATLASANIPHAGSPLGVLTVSAGVSASISSWKNLLKSADKALYSAKKGGRNRVMQLPPN